jgi:NADH-ubiquinone oxidoreductase chain 3
MTLFILIVSVIALLFLFINLIFAPHNPYQEKDSMFECGFHSFQQSRLPFNIAFFIYALVYLLLDLEVLLIFPFAVSEYANNLYGLLVVLGFIIIVTIGFVFELGRGALEIASRQSSNLNIPKHISTTSWMGKINLKDSYSSISYIKEQKRFSSSSGNTESDMRSSL